MENNTVKKILLIASGLLLFAYIIYRAYFLSFTHDESLTYSIVSEKTIWEHTTNNHYLNTNLIALCQNLFGKSEFSLRLPNVLAFVLYFIAFFYIMKPVKNILVVILGIAILLLNPFFLDFFSLARGYGLSFAFMMLSMAFLLRDSLKEIPFKRYLLNFGCSMLCATLALYACFGAMNYYIACFGIFVIFYIYQVIKNTDTSYRKPYLFIVFAAIFVIPLALGINKLLLLDKANELFHGSNSFQYTIDSFISHSFYWQPYPRWLFVLIKCLLILSVPLGVTLVVLKKEYYRELSISLLLISMIIFGFFIEFYLFQANFPAERTTLFFVPLIGLIAVHLALHINKYYPSIAKVNSLIISVVGICLIVHFSTSANLKYTQTWKYDSYTKDAMKYIKENIPQDGGIRTISNDWIFEPTINFYIDIWNIPLHKTDRSSINLNTDFIYRINNSDDWNGYQVIESYKDISAELLKSVKN